MDSAVYLVIGDNSSIPINQLEQKWRQPLHELVYSMDFGAMTMLHIYV